MIYFLLYYKIQIANIQENNISIIILVMEYNKNDKLYLSMFK